MKKYISSIQIKYNRINNYMKELNNRRNILPASQIKKPRNKICI